MTITHGVNLEWQQRVYDHVMAQPTGMQCYAKGCMEVATIDWPSLPQGWAVRGDQKVASCPEHTDVMPPYQTPLSKIVKRAKKAGLQVTINTFTESPRPPYHGFHWEHPYGRPGPGGMRS
jgi:hypothetical protein